jgi:hypothetical protein
MNTVRDVRCPDGHYEISVFYKTEDGPPPCPCGSPRTAFWATREMQGLAAQNKVDNALAGFTPVKVDGQMMTREQMTAYKNAYADRQGIPRDSIDFAPVGNKMERVEDRRHRAVENRRRNGYDEQQFREHQRGETR